MFVHAGASSGGRNVATKWQCSRIYLLNASRVQPEALQTAEIPGLESGPSRVRPCWFHYNESDPSCDNTWLTWTTGHGYHSIDTLNLEPRSVPQNTVLALQADQV
jgi:hypothetical protein